MKKVVFVVEGQTEQVFLSRFLEHLVALLPCHIHCQSLHGGVLYELTPRGVAQDQCSHYIRIIDVGNDEKVNSFIEENIPNFKGKGFEMIYGLRDQYSGDKKRKKVDPEALAKLTASWGVEFKVLVDVIVAVEEVEAWFLCVPDFFAKYDASLTVHAVSGILKIDLTKQPVESISHPSVAITRVLATVRQSYKKRLDDAHRIVDRLDFDALYLEKSKVVSALGKLVSALDNALAP